MVGSRDKERTRDRDRPRDERHRSRQSIGHNSRSRRSPDCYYRNDNSDDDSYDNTRRHRSRSHRRDRSRSKESRDRDRDRESSSGANTHSSRYYNEDYNSSNDNQNDSYDSRDKSQHQRDRREEIPNNTIMIRGLATHITENNIVSHLAEHNLIAKDIRLMRKKETGISRGFAFIEFSLIEDAIKWKELTQGYVVFDEECEASIHYSIPKDSFNADKNIMKNDWTCYKCGVNNFKRREECFKCGTPKEESMANDTGDEVSLTPTNALLLRNLPALTTEERILTILGTITALPIKSIRILRDPTYNISRGICLVELHTTVEASQLFGLLSSMTPPFVVDDIQVQINYGKRNASLAHINPNTTNAAVVALAAAQWRNLDEDIPNQNSWSQTQSKNSNKKSGNVCTNGIEYQKYDTPDVTTFVFDDTSGYYYDSKTGFYYDSSTQYYFNPQSQQYLYWDSSNNTYLGVESKGGQTSEEDKREKQKDLKPDKVKIAKKIAKDMEKWAKTLNQKKDTSRSWIATEPTPSAEPTPSSANKNSTADAGFAVLESQTSIVDTEPSTLDLVQQQFKALESKSSLDNKNSLQSNAYELLKIEEKRLTDWSKMACLLCKRQFPSNELLTKHQQLSDLHKTNLNVLKHKVLSDEQIEELERTEKEAGYRDRAKERRKKYGIPETPETSKLKTKYLSELEERDLNESIVMSQQTPISSDNIGSKMLKAMGWTEGTGLGRKKQGMSDIIKVERRQEGVGLGIKTSSTLSDGKNLDYKEGVRRAMAQRFQEMNK